LVFIFYSERGENFANFAKSAGNTFCDFGFYFDLFDIFQRQKAEKEKNP
jgi:hypothetical protein